MTFSAELSVRESDIVRIRLKGDLDAAAAPTFAAVMERALASVPKRIVLVMNELTFLGSAGLRAVVIAKHKLGRGTEMQILGAAPNVVSALKMTGFKRSVVLADSLLFGGA
jgi:anti-anti-sigma factor